MADAVRLGLFVGKRADARKLDVDAVMAAERVAVLVDYVDAAAADGAGSDESDSYGHGGLLMRRG